MARVSSLAVWCHGERVGIWMQARGGGASFQYDPAWLASDAGCPISLSLPFTPGNMPHRGDRVTWFFENLLPDSEDIRARLRTKFGVESTRPIDLLAEIYLLAVCGHGRPRKELFDLS